MAKDKTYGIKAILTFKDANSGKVLTAANVKLEQFEQRSKKLGKKTKGFAQGLGKLGIPMLGVGAAAVYGFGKAVGAASEFAGSIRFAGALAGFETPKQFKVLEDEAKRLGITTSFTAKQAADGMIVLGRAGLKTADQFKSVLGPALRLAESDNMAIADAAQIVTSTVRSLGMKMSESKAVADAYAAAAAGAQTSVTQMGNAMTYVGATAGALKIPMGDLSTAIAALANKGIAGSMAGTALNQALIKTVKPGDSATAALNRMGLSIKSIQKPIPVMVRTLQRGLKRLGSNTKRAKALLDIFGIRGGRAMMALTNTSRKELKRLSGIITKAMKTGVGGASDIAEKKLDSIQGDFIKLKSAAEGVMLAIGSMFTRNMRRPVQAITFLLRGFAGVVTWVTDSIADAFDWLTRRPSFQALAGFFEGLWEAAGTAGRVLADEFAPMIRDAGQAIDWLSSLLSDDEPWDRFGANAKKTGKEAGITFGGMITKVLQLVPRAFREISALSKWATDGISLLAQLVVAELEFAFAKLDKAMTGFARKHQAWLAKISPAMGAGVKAIASRAPAAEARYKGAEKNMNALRRQIGGLAVVWQRDLKAAASPQKVGKAAATEEEKVQKRSYNIARAERRRRIVASKQEAAAAAEARGERDCIKVKSKLKVDGRELAKAKGRQDVRALERMGLGMRVGAPHRRIVEGTGFVPPSVYGVQ